MFQYKNTVLKPINPKIKSSFTNNSNYQCQQFNNNKNTNMSCYRPIQNISSKVQNNVMIKPSSGYDRQIDYRFQTEEEIQIEEECRRFQNQGNYQKKNNSFSSSGPESQIIQKPRKRKKKLQFYNCDSLAIRPSGNVKQSLGKEQQQISQTDQSIIKLTKSNQSSKIINGQGTINYDISDKLTQSLSKSMVRNLKPSSLKKQKHKIFDQRYSKIKSKFYEPLPLALVPQNQRPNKNKNIQDQCHIIFETDQITQCCL